VYLTKAVKLPALLQAVKAMQIACEQVSKTVSDALFQRSVIVDIFHNAEEFCNGKKFKEYRRRSVR
jgi:hypothetical protein